VAYVKEWSARSHGDLDLRDPDLLPRSPLGESWAYRQDAERAAREIAATFGTVDVAYLDPPYNQHRYHANYHIWETLVRWDQPEVWGAACRRADEKAHDSPYNGRKTILPALTAAIDQIDARRIIVSFSTDAFVSREQMMAMLSSRGKVSVVTKQISRYIGWRNGTFNHEGVKVGPNGEASTTEILFVCDR
jgi:adenine-specific DNA-methyltransferase